MRQKVTECNVAQLDTFLHKHISNFSEFKVKVLDNLVDWHQKSTDLSRLATKYYDTLEEYKMLFVQTKQLVKEKDMMVRRLTQNAQQNRQANAQHLDVMRKEL